MTGRTTSGLTRAESRSVARQELVRAAARLFLRDGFVATSLADIAAAAGVTKGAVYANFASKEDLFLEANAVAPRSAPARRLAAANTKAFAIELGPVWASCSRPLMPIR